MNNRFNDHRTVNRTRSFDDAKMNLGLRDFMLKVYNLMAIALVVTGLVAMAASSSPALMMTIFGSPLKWVVMFAPLAVVFFLSARIQSMSYSTAQMVFWGYAALVGLSLSSIFMVFTGESIARVFFITSATFGATSLYGYTTKKDLSGFGSFLFMGVIGIVIAGLVNLFLQSSALQFAISAIGVLVFTGLTAYDTQMIKDTYYTASEDDSLGKIALMGALSLYLDFINLFISLMQLLGQRRD